MQYEIIPCVDGDAEYIEEQADQATRAGVFWLQKNGRPR